MKIIPVLAPSYQEFRYFVKENQLRLNQFAYISRYEQIRGYAGVVITLPTWQRNPNFDTEFRRTLIEMESMKYIFLARHVEI
ncbi:hypothetical protein MHH42_30865 [Bacillus sp. FSL L8-0099]|uniref:hypothetical protein n=1 Tax=unclassified Bacillus (in: firmicutes) TaxID=185979 RepID=UPI0030F73D0E